MFTEAQIVATKGVFWLAGYEGELRTLPPAGDEIAFILEQDDVLSLKDEHVVGRVLAEVLGRKVWILASVGNVTVPFG